MTVPDPRGPMSAGGFTSQVTRRTFPSRPALQPAVPIPPTMGIESAALDLQKRGANAMELVCRFSLLH